MTDQTSSLADLPPCTAVHSSPKIRRIVTLRCPPSGPFFLPHDKLPSGRKVYKYALTVVVIASRYKEAEPLTSEDSAEVAKAFQSIYKGSPLKWPRMLQVNPGREFMGSVTKEMENHKTYIGRTRFNRTLRRALSAYSAISMVSKTPSRNAPALGPEMLLPSDQRSTAWVKRLLNAFPT